MTDLNATPPDAPYGSWPRRRRGPLVVLIALFGAWFLFLLWLTLTYPALPH